MKPNVALAFVLAGVTLHLLSTDPTNGHLRFVALASAFVVAVIGFLTLSEYLYGWNLNIDHLLFTQLAGALGTSASARMAPTSALWLLLIRVALLVLNVR